MISITDDLRCYYNSNMKEKTPLELERENRILQSNWNSLREWLRNDDNRVYLCNQNRKNGKVFEAGFKAGLIVVLDKMNELEGVDNENN